MFHKTNKNSIWSEFLKGTLTVLISVLAIFTIAKAGNITPPSGTPVAQFFSLSEIYTRLTTNATTTEGGHSFAFSDSLTSTSRTLTEIYNAIPTIDATKVLTGTAYLGVSGTIANNGSFSLTASSSDQTVTAGYYSGGTLFGDADLIASYIANGFNIFGVTGTFYGDTDASKVGVTASASGTLLANMNNGTGLSGFLVDDYNNASSTIPTGRYVSAWTACSVGNNYCGTGDSGADAKDESTGLIWSMPCNGVGCTSFSDAAVLTYSWSSGAANNNSRTAVQLCSDHSGWSLPSQKQQMMAYVDGSYGNLEATGTTGRTYWSSTTKSFATTEAWHFIFTHGTNGSTLKTSSNHIRCVRSN